MGHQTVDAEEQIVITYKRNTSPLCHGLFHTPRGMNSLAEGVIPTTHSLRAQTQGLQAVHVMMGHRPALCVMSQTTVGKVLMMIEALDHRKDRLYWTPGHVS